MKAYVVTTGALFGVLTVVHVWRMAEERHPATEPWYILATLVAAGLALWAARLLRRDRLGRS